MENEEKKPITILSAKIADEICDYSYKSNVGPTAGDKISVDGSNIIHDDMKAAFAALNVHMAIMDDVFKHAGVQFETLQEVLNHEFTFLYRVNGIKIKNNGDADSVVLVGNKFVSTSNGYISLETPKVLLEDLSGYVWHKELKEAVDLVRDEVEQYRNGKFILNETEEELDKKAKNNPKQRKLKFVVGDADVTVSAGGDGEIVQASGEEAEKIMNEFDQGAV